MWPSTAAGRPRSWPSPPPLPVTTNLSPEGREARGRRALARARATSCFRRCWGLAGDATQPPRPPLACPLLSPPLSLLHAATERHRYSARCYRGHRPPHALPTRQEAPPRPPLFLLDEPRISGSSGASPSSSTPPPLHRDRRRPYAVPDASSSRLSCSA